MELEELLKKAETDLEIFEPRAYPITSAQPVQKAEVIMPLNPMPQLHPAIPKRRLDIYVLGIEKEHLSDWGPCLLCARDIDPKTGLMEVQRYSIKAIDSYETIQVY